MNKFEFHSAVELAKLAEEHGMTIGEVALNDAAYDYGMKISEVRNEMEKRLDVVMDSIKTGLQIKERTASGLSGGDARKLKHLGIAESILGSNLHRAVTYSFAITENNALNGKIVAFPTAGSSGVVPASLVAMYECKKVSYEKLLMGMFAAGAVGIIIAENAMISGAAGGCQAEVGSAGAMAAAGIAEMLDLKIDNVLDSAAITLKGMLGLVCDPIAGLVECPCIKRNAVAVSNAYTAVEMTMAGIRSNVPLDEVITSMKEIGLAMNPKFKETAEGGIATSKTAKMVWKKLFAKDIGNSQNS
jgi:L-serine dehydratase